MSEKFKISVVLGFLLVLGSVVIFVNQEKNKSEEGKVIKPVAVSCEEAKERGLEKVPILFLLKCNQKETIMYDRSVPKNKANVYLAYFKGRDPKTDYTKDQFDYLLQTYRVNKREYEKTQKELKSSKAMRKTTKNYQIYAASFGRVQEMFIILKQNPQFVIGKVSISNNKNPKKINEVVKRLVISSRAKPNQSSNQGKD